MSRGSLFSLTAAIALLSASSASAASAVRPVVAAPAASSDTGYYTYHYDNDRTGWNPTETQLSASAVHSSRFGFVRALPADGVVYAQPLYVPHVQTPTGNHNLVIIASENDGVFAYDADTGSRVWRRSLIDPAAGVTSVSLDSVSGCTSITPTIGISSTPVIDPKTRTLYLVDKIQFGSGSSQTFENRLHALSVSDGRDLLPATTIGGSVTLEDGTTQPFFAQREQNRPGLALANGMVYIAFGSSCDRVPGAVHGWLFAYNAATLARQAIFNTTNTSANDYLGSIWQSTFAPSIDKRGNLYLSTGNGTFDANSGHAGYAESILSLDASLHVRDFFTPYQAAALNTNDQDVGSAGVMLVPSSDTPGRCLAIGGEKDGLVYLLDATHLGGFDASTNRVLQTVPLEPAPNALYGGPAYFDGRVYWGATQAPMYAFALTTTHGPHLAPISHTPNSFPGEGGEIPAVSSNGTRPGSAVVWATTRAGYGQTFRLYAYDAFDLNTVLFAGNVGTWSSMGDAFLTPTVAGGHVFVPGDGRGVAEFGLK